MSKVPDEMAKIQEILHGTKVDGKKSVWATTVETMGMSDGKTKKDDVKVKTLEEGVHMMEGLVQAKQQEEDDDEKWKFSLTPLNDFNATLTDLLMAFVKWSYKDDESYNISKAFRRLEAYVTWMEDNRSILSQKLTEDTKKRVHAMWGPMQLTYAKDNKTLVWWIDLSDIQSKDIKTMNHDMTVLYFVWACHMVLFQKNSENLILMENLHKCTLLHLFTMLPADLSAKLDRLTIGILPLKMKSIYLLHTPRWMSIMLTLLKPFLSKKMRQRMKSVNDKDVEKTVTDVVGMEGIPQGFCGIEGLVEQDEFAKIIQ